MAPANANAKKVSSHIPDDLAISILSKLPLKSLKRFTCARKSWSLLLENPHFVSIFGKNFISAHCSLYDGTCVLLNQFTFPHCLYLLDGEKFENKVILELPRRFREQDTYEWPLRISGCVNGIICLLDVYRESRILWNPATKECIHIPPSPSQVLASNMTMLNLHGFGYDHVRHDYKVIQCVRISRYSQNLLWEIYSVRRNSWRKLNVKVPEKLGSSEVYLNGMCHWMGRPNNQPLAVKCVVSFNLSSEVFVTTPLLIDMHDGDNFVLAKRQLVVLNGSIAMISMYSMTASFHISILGEPGVKGSWVELFIVESLPFIRQPIGAWENGKIFLRTKDDDLVCFDLNTQTFEEVGLKGDASSLTAIYKKNLSPIIRV